MLKQHKQNEADLTVACMEVSIDEAKEFWCDGDRRISYWINNFTEATLPCVSAPSTWPARSMASMGIYIFDKKYWHRHYWRVQRSDSSHDFGKDIIPKLND